MPLERIQIVGLPFDWHLGHIQYILVPHWTKMPLRLMFFSAMDRGVKEVKILWQIC